jgi:hypothetical protein
MSKVQFWFHLLMNKAAIMLKIIFSSGCGCEWMLLGTKEYPKVTVLAAWSENCKWYSSLPLGAVVSLFYESV